jgi:hypothetical protein
MINNIKSFFIIVFEIIIGFIIQSYLFKGNDTSSSIYLSLTIWFLFISLFTSVFNPLILAKKGIHTNLFDLKKISLYLSFIYLLIELPILFLFSNFGIIGIFNIVLLSVALFFTLASYELVEFCRSTNLGFKFSIITVSSLIIQLSTIILIKFLFINFPIDTLVILSYFFKGGLLYLLMYKSTLKISRVDFIPLKLFFLQTRYSIAGKGISSIEQFIISKYIPEFNSSIYFVNFFNSKILFVFERIILFKSNSDKKIMNFIPFFIILPLLIFSFFLFLLFIKSNNFTYLLSFVPKELLTFKYFIFLLFFPFVLLNFQSILFYLLPQNKGYQFSLKLYNKISFIKIGLFLILFSFSSIFSMGITSLIIFFFLILFSIRNDI